MKLKDKYCKHCGKYVATIEHHWYMWGYSKITNKEYGATEYSKNGELFWLCHDCQRNVRIFIPENWKPICFDKVRGSECFGERKVSDNGIVSSEFVPECETCPFKRRSAEK